jgi:hypothetical protein
MPKYSRKLEKSTEKFFSEKMGALLKYARNELDQLWRIWKEMLVAQLT